MSSRSHRPRSALATSVLVCLGGLLSGCGLLGSPVEPGTVVTGRDQEPAGDTATVRLPSGRLQITVGDPVDGLDEDETSDLEARDAPGGGSLVPVSWAYEFTSAALPYVVGNQPPATLSLVVDGETYVVGQPYQVPEGNADDVLQEGRTYYVAVEGSAEDVEVAVELDGLTQTVDPETGRRDVGVARALYEERYPLTEQTCPSRGWRTTGPLQVEVECEIRRGGVLPYVASKGWAEPGHAWLVVDAEVALPQVTFAGASGPDEVRYRVTSITDETTAAGEKPTEPMTEAYGEEVAAGVLIFDLTQEQAVSPEVDFSLEYTVESATERGEVEDYPFNARFRVERSVSVAP